MKLDSAGGLRSLGRKLLLRAVETSSVSAIATRVGCSHTTISRLASGRATTDSYALRLGLARVYGIPLGAWDESDEIDT